MLLLKNEGRIVTMYDEELKWIKDNGSWYYYYPNGEKGKGWRKIDGDWYYLYQKGPMTWDNTIDGYYLNDHNE